MKMSGFQVVGDLGGSDAFKAGVGPKVSVGEGHGDVAFGVARGGQCAGQPVQTQQVLEALPEAFQSGVGVTGLRRVVAERHAIGGDHLAEGLVVRVVQMLTKLQASLVA